MVAVVATPMEKIVQFRSGSVTFFLPLLRSDRASARLLVVRVGRRTDETADWREID
jgi:hypothetical protein